MSQSDPLISQFLRQMAHHLLIQWIDRVVDGNWRLDGSCAGFHMVLEIYVIYSRPMTLGVTFILLRVLAKSLIEHNSTYTVIAVSEETMNLHCYQHALEIT